MEKPAINMSDPTQVNDMLTTEGMLMVVGPDGS